MLKGGPPVPTTWTQFRCGAVTSRGASKRSRAARLGYWRESLQSSIFSQECIQCSEEEKGAHVLQTSHPPGTTQNRRCHGCRRVSYLAPRVRNWKSFLWNSNSN